MMITVDFLYIYFKFLRKIKNLFLFVFFAFFLASCGGNSLEKCTSEYNERIFPYASERSTAYAENQKIAFKNEHKFVTFLDLKGGKYQIRIIHLFKNKIKDDIYLDVVASNHGGGSIALDRSNRLCVAYDGHNRRLRYKCTSNPFDISEWKEYPVFQDSNKNNVWQTYPNIYFDNNNVPYVLFREVDPIVRNPKLKLIKFDNDKSETVFEYKTNDNTRNFTATFSKTENNLHILFMGSGSTKSDIRFNKGVYLLVSNNNGKSFSKVNIKDTSGSNREDLYISNMIDYQGKLYFFILDRKKPTEFFRLYIFNKKKNTYKEHDMLQYERLNSLIKTGYIPNVRATLGMNSKREIFVLLPFAKKEDYSWSSKTNKIHYFKLDSEFKEMDLLYVGGEGSWLGNVQKQIVKGVPDIVFTNMNLHETVLVTYGCKKI